MKAKAKTQTGPVMIDNLEVCRRLGVAFDTWRKRVKRGAAPLPVACQGRRGYYRVADVEHYERTGQWPRGTRFNAPDLGQTPPSPLSDGTQEYSHKHVGFERG